MTSPIRYYERVYPNKGFLDGWRVVGGWGYQSYRANTNFERHYGLRRAFIKSQNLIPEGAKCGQMLGNVVVWAVPLQFNKGIRKRFENCSDDPNAYTTSDGFFEAYICSWK